MHSIASSHQVPSLSHPLFPSRYCGLRVKLPKLVMKKRSGDLTKWTTFLDSLELVVHTSPDFTGMDKFSYLHTLFDKSVAKAVSRLKVTAANHDEAVLLLKKRFRNKQQIVHKHMDAILSPQPVNPYNLKRLCLFFDAVESNI